MTPTIRTLSLAEIGTLVDWAAGEGWNPGRHDAAAFHAADPDGFLGAFVGDEMVAGIAAVAYGEDFGFIGLYICRPDLRGKGYGKAVWNAGMAHLSGRTVGLDGVPAQQANYRSMGFVDDYQTFRFSGRFAGAASSDPVRPMSVDLFQSVAAFDRMHFPAPRAAFLKRWIAPPHLALVCMDGDTVRGYGVARACREGFKVGPLFANDIDVAITLCASLADACGGDIHIDVPGGQEEFSTLLEAAGLSRGFETARMYRAPAPAIRIGGVYGVTSLELG
nr:GNAT family N-acetyltransferase [Mesorhizobium sp.]